MSACRKACSCTCGIGFGDGAKVINSNVENTGFWWLGVTGRTGEDRKAWNGKDAEEEAGIWKLNQAMENMRQKSKIGAEE